MLWMKNWLETRWRLLVGVFMLSGTWILGYLRMGQPLVLPQSVRFGGLVEVISLIALIQAITLAGSGVRTQAPLRATKGLHASTHFTLSLPVSRTQLLSSRMALGLLELAGLILASFVVVWSGMASDFRDLNFSIIDLLRFGVTIGALVAPIFALSTLLSTFLDDVWQMWGAMLSIIGFRVLAGLVDLPESLDPFKTIASATPFVSHTIPWTLVFLCVTVAAAFTAAAVRIVETRDY